jgi:hypothetical protein
MNKHHPLASHLPQARSRDEVLDEAIAKDKDLPGILVHRLKKVEGYGKTNPPF